MELSLEQLIDLRWALYHFTANKPGFFADEKILRVRKLITLIDQEIAKRDDWTEYVRHLPHKIFSSGGDELYSSHQLGRLF